MNNENQLQEQVVQLQPINTTNQKGSKVISIIIGIFLLVAIIGGLSWMYFDNNAKNKDLNNNKNENNNVDNNNNNTGEITIEKLRTYPETDASEFEYSENNGEITIDNFIGNSEIVVIPEKIDGKPVTIIGQSSFGNSNIKAVSTGKNVKVIEKQAFGNSTISVVITYEGLLEIQENAFLNCKYLMEIDLANSIISMGYGALADCVKLKSVSLPDGLSILSGSVLRNTSIEELKIPAKVTTIEGNAFGSCTQLKNIYIPNTVTQIARFGDSPNVKIITPSGSYAEQFSKDNNIPFENK